MLRLDQVEIVRHPAKIKIVSAGRRFGKTVTGGNVAVNVLCQHGKVAWVAPSYKNTRPLWRWATAVCGNEKRLDISKGEKIISTHHGGFLSIYSADNADSIRGEAFHLVIVDEAAQIPEEVITDIIMPTLADHDGELLLFGTPRGKNWYFHWFNRGQIPGEEMASWQVPTSANPMPSIQKAFDRARDMLPERTFRQEWLAQFVDDGGEVFRNVRACAKAQFQPSGIPGHSYVIGVDWAKHVDYTVFAVFDINLQALVHLERMQSIDYMVQCGRLKLLAEKFGRPAVIAETNSMGTAVIEQLYRDGLNVMPFTTTQATKTVVIDALTMAFERGAITILDDRVLVGELEAYTMIRTSSGLLKYSAPSGLHDDCVMALAFAYHGGRSIGDPSDWILKPR